MYNIIIRRDNDEKLPVFLQVYNDTMVYFKEFQDVQTGNLNIGLHGCIRLGPLPYLNKEAIPVLMTPLGRVLQGLPTHFYFSHGLQSPSQFFSQFYVQFFLYSMTKKSSFRTQFGIREDNILKQFYENLQHMTHRGAI